MTSIEIFFIRVLKISLINFLTYFYTKKITNKISTKANIYKECIILIINILITVIVYSTSSYINGIIITIIGLTIIFSKKASYSSFWAVSSGGNHLFCPCRPPLGPLCFSAAQRGGRAFSTWFCTWKNFSSFPAGFTALFTVSPPPGPHTFHRRGA